MNDEESNGKGGVSSRLEPLGKYILKLYAVGGIPLVFIGIGAVILVFGGAGQRPMIAGLSLCVFGLLTWVASAYVATHRWKTEMEITSNQDAQVIKAICAIAVDQNTDVVEAKVKALLGSLDKLGVRWIGKKSTSAKPPAEGAPQGRAP